MKNDRHDSVRLRALDESDRVAADQAGGTVIRADANAVQLPKGSTVTGHGTEPISPLRRFLSMRI